MPAPEKTPPQPDTNKLEVSRVADAAQSRRLWVHPHGYFIRGLGNDWFEKWDDGEKAPNLLSEVQRTKEFVETRHCRLAIIFRFYKDKTLIKDERPQGSGQFQQVYEGKWEKLPVAKDRQLWVEAHGYLIRGLGSDWFQKWDDGKRIPNLFSEVQRTEEFVELRHYLLAVTFRLFKDKALMKDNRPKGSGPFEQAAEGEWQALPK